MRYRVLLLLGLTLGGVANGGPDLVCSEIIGSTSFGVVDGIAAYSFGTTVCNIGDEPVEYDANSNRHPLYAQSIYKLKDHRIEQIGIGFVRHTTVPLAGNACGLGCTPAGFTALGVGCSDSSSSSVNGAQGLMGPRTEVNAQTGAYPYPFTSINQTGDAIYKRVQVSLADVSDPDALYFVETQVIVPDEETAEARNNNVSYRQVQFAPGSATATLVGPTYAQQPAVFAWRDHGNGINTPSTEVLISTVTAPQGGLLHVLSGVHLNSTTSLYAYTYIVHNQSSSSEAWLFAACTGGGDAHNFQFRAPQYHDDLDGDVDPRPWLLSTDRCNTSMSYGTRAAQDSELNTIRWGTAYQFAFTTASPPIKLFSGEIGAVYINTNVMDFDEYISVPAITPFCYDACCPPDLNHDGQLNFFDVSLFLQDYNAGGDYNGDGGTNFFDVSSFLTEYNQGCP